MSLKWSRNRGAQRGIPRSAARGPFRRCGACHRKGRDDCGRDGSCRRNRTSCAAGDQIHWKGRRFAPCKNTFFGATAPSWAGLSRVAGTRTSSVIVRRAVDEDRVDWDQQTSCANSVGQSCGGFCLATIGKHEESTRSWVDTVGPKGLHALHVQLPTPRLLAKVARQHGRRTMFVIDRSTRSI